MRSKLQTLSQIFLIAGALMIAVSYLAYDFENLFLNLLLYTTLSIGFILNLIAVWKGAR